MGFLKDLVGVAAPIAGNIFGGPIGGAIGGLIGGAVSGSGQPKSTTSTQQQQLDPRISAMLFGENGQTGLLKQYQSMLDTPRSAAGTNFTNASGNYLDQYGASDLGAVRNSALGVMGGNAAPTVQAAQASAGQAGTAQAALGAYMGGSQADAPAQNNLNLTSSYDSLINGPAGANPYLTGAIQKGINQSSNAFGNMLTDAKSATQDLLGNIRGGAIAAGQFGGSRQGIAEGKALDSFSTNISRAASQFGQNNTDAAVAAQAGAYNSDRDRQLAATQGLSGQQYATAFKNADIKNAAEAMNVNNLADFAKYNAGLAQQSNLFNATQAQNSHQLNAGLNQQANLANQQAQLTTNAQNNSGALAGGGLLSGLLGSALGTVNQGDNWSLDRAQGVNSLLAPYLGANSSTSRTDPLYSSPTGNALAGLGLGSQLGGLLGGGKDSMGGSMGGLADLFGGKFMNF